MADRKLRWFWMGWMIALFGAGGLFIVQSRKTPGHARSVSQKKAASIPDVISGSFVLAEERQDRFSKRATFTRKDEVLRLETISDLDPQSAVTVIDEGVIAVQALYANALSDYPGDLSRQVATPARFRPVFTRRGEGEVPRAYFLLYATERLTFGAVSEDTAKRRALLGWIYCQDERVLYRVEFFSPRTTPAEVLEDYFLHLSCN